MDLDKFDAEVRELYELLGGRDENARFAGKEMEDLPKLVLNDFITDT